MIFSDVRSGPRPSSGSQISKTRRSSATPSWLLGSKTADLVVRSGQCFRSPCLFRASRFWLCVILRRFSQTLSGTDWPCTTSCLRDLTQNVFSFCLEMSLRVCALSVSSRARRLYFLLTLVVFATSVLAVKKLPSERS